MKSESNLTAELLKLSGLSEDQIRRLVNRPIPFMPSYHGDSTIILDNDSRHVTGQVPRDKAPQIAEALSVRIAELKSQAPADNTGMRPQWARGLPEHSDLREWLQTLPPLPYTVERCGMVSGDEVLFSLTRDDEEKDRIREFLCHCANVLPSLLKAAEDARLAVVQAVANNEQAADMPCETFDALADAIAAAHGGNVAARLTTADLPTVARLCSLLGKAAQSLRDRAGEDPGACLTAHSPEAQDIELAEQIEGALATIAQTGQVSAPIAKEEEDHTCPECGFTNSHAYGCSQPEKD